MIGAILGLLSGLVVGLVVFTFKAIRWSMRSWRHVLAGCALFVLALGAGNIALRLLIDTALGAWSAFHANTGLQLVLAAVVGIVLSYKIIRRCGLMGR